MTAQIIRVSPSQAAQLFGVNERSIRRAIKNAEVRYIIVQGRYKINFEDLVRWSQKMPARQHKRDTQGIGQYVGKWRINNPKYSPSTKSVLDEVDDNNGSNLGNNNDKIDD